MGPDVPTSQSSRPRILWVGRMLFSGPLRIREVELASAMADSARLFALDRSDALPRSPQGLAGKLATRARLYMGGLQVLEENSILRFRMGVVGANGPLFNRLAAPRNWRRVQSAAHRFQCTHVFLSSPFYFLPPRRRELKVHFDLVDNFHDEWPDTLIGRARQSFLRDALRNADSLSAASLSLRDHAEGLADRPAAYAPNGAPDSESKDADARAIRKQFRLEGRFVVGFICNHDMEFDGKERLVRAFTRARLSRPELALLVVGPGTDKVTNLAQDAGIVPIGPVSPNEVASYFQACDAGVYPFEIGPAAQYALPLNVLEFSKHCKPVLSMPLKELQRQALPNVRFTVDDSVEAWAAALADPATFAPPDQAALAAAMVPFDWRRSAEIIRQEMGL